MGSLKHSFAKGTRTIGTWFGISKDKTKGLETKLGITSPDSPKPPPAIPLPDEEEIARIRRRRATRTGGRASTILSDNETFGP